MISVLAVKTLPEGTVPFRRKGLAFLSLPKPNNHTSNCAYSLKRTPPSISSHLTSLKEHPGERHSKFCSAPCLHIWLFNGTLTNFPSSLTPCACTLAVALGTHSEKAAVWKPGRRPSLILDFSASGTVWSKRLFKHPVRGVLLWQPGLRAASVSYMHGPCCLLQAQPSLHSPKLTSWSCTGLSLQLLLLRLPPAHSCPRAFVGASLPETTSQLLLKFLFPSKVESIPWGYYQEMMPSGESQSLN